MKKSLLFTVLILSIPFLLSAQARGPRQYEANHPELSGLDSVDFPGYIYYHEHGHHPIKDISGSPMRYEPSQGAPLFLTNGGFESADYTGWNGFIGYNDSSSAGPLRYIVPGIFTGQINPNLTSDTVRHSIMQLPLAGPDPIGGFPTVPSGLGTCTSVLGNQYPQYHGQAIEQTWTVGPQDTAFIFSFAVVIFAGSHPVNEGAYFEYELVDSAGIVLYSRHDESDTVITFYLNAGNNTYYLPWESDTFDLTTHIGQDITVRFTTAGCIWGGHWCYAYIDCDPDSGAIIGIDEQVSTSGIVYPNPSANGIFNVQVLWNDQAPNVFDISGRRVDAICTQTAVGWIIDISQQPKGTYFAQILTSNGVKHCSLIY